MPYTEMGKTQLKLTLISGHAKRNSNLQFTSLAHLLDQEFLKQCFHSLNRNKAKGVDNVGWYDYEVKLEENIRSLEQRLKTKKFRPLPARRVYIPKDDGNKRPLGISAIENKIVEKGVAMILQSIYEQDFSDNSFGFRPKRNCHQALKELNDQIMGNPINHIVEADIKGFFDNVSHELLLEALKVRVKDSSMLHLIEKFLKAGYIDRDLLVTSDEGTAQGSIVSPLLANVFLHYVLDIWFDKVVKAHAQGYCELVRYADDFVCVAQYENDARRIEKALQGRFNRFKLELHTEKTRKFSFGRFESINAQSQKRKANTFDFLGFTHYCGKTRKGFFLVKCKTSKTKLAKKCKAMTRWLKSIRNQKKPKEWWGILKAKLRGHFQYYGVSGNYDSLETFYNHTMRVLHKWLNRRSQKSSMNWADFNKYMECYPVPKPRIVHNFYTW
jgi:RNA-directed DNA polymerase